jgi:hypothetical protein
MDKTLLGYQGRTALDETVINPKDKEVVKSWVGIDIIVMSGHTEKTVTKTEEVLSKLQRRNSYTNIPTSALGPHSSPQPGLKAAMAAAAAEEKEDGSVSVVEDAESVLAAAAPPTSPSVVQRQQQQVSTTGGGGGGGGGMGSDAAVAKVITVLKSMNDKIGDLAATVDNLSARVDNMAMVAEQPVMMVPQRVRMQMNDRIEDLQSNVGTIHERVELLSQRASSPVLMVPQMAAGGGHMLQPMTPLRDSSPQAE